MSGKKRIMKDKQRDKSLDFILAEKTAFSARCFCLLCKKTGLEENKTVGKGTRFRAYSRYSIMRL